MFGVCSRRTRVIASSHQQGIMMCLGPVTDVDAGICGPWDVLHRTTPVPIEKYITNRERERKGLLLELGDDTYAADQADGGKTAPKSVLAVRDAKQREVVNDTREHQLGAHNDGSRCTSTELWNDKNRNNDKDRSDHTSGPRPPRCLGNHDGKIRWWAAFDLDQEVDTRSNSACKNRTKNS